MYLQFQGLWTVGTSLLLLLTTMLRPMRCFRARALGQRIFLFIIATIVGVSWNNRLAAPEIYEHRITGHGKLPPATLLGVCRGVCIRPGLTRNTSFSNALCSPEPGTQGESAYHTSPLS